MARFDALDELVDAIGKASFQEREALRDRLLEVARTFEDPKRVIEHLESAKKGIPSLEARWEVDEVIEAITPPPAPREEPEQDDDPNRPLTARDLDLLYDDPRGIQLHKTKKGSRYFLTQVDPHTYQPQTIELQPQEVVQIKAQLQGSPYWVKLDD